MPDGPSSTAAAAIRPEPSVSAISTVVMSPRFNPPPATNATKQRIPAISSVGHHAPARASQRSRGALEPARAPPSPRPCSQRRGAGSPALTPALGGGAGPVAAAGGLAGAVGTHAPSD